MFACNEKVPNSNQCKEDISVTSSYKAQYQLQKYIKSWNSKESNRVDNNLHKQHYLQLHIDPIRSHGP